MKKLPMLYHLSAAAVVSVFALLVYGGIQQSYRTGLNDPQIQMARDISFRLAHGRSIESFLSAESFDITQSLSPFIVLYDAKGKAIRSNALLDNKMPQMPVGVFEVAKLNGEHDVTWQPRKGVRMAMVIERTNTAPVAFVAAGRSMQEVEYRTENMQLMVIFAWIICMGIIVVTALLSILMRPKPATSFSFSG